jgi:RNA polymerase sigma-70 factor (ECF subfamily)
MAVAYAQLEVAAAYTTHAASVTRYLTSLTRDRSAAEDLAQEAFVRLLGEVGAGRRPGNVGGWLFRVAANLAASRGRHLAVVAKHAQALPHGDPPPSPEDVLAERERSRALNIALARLRPSDREIVLLAAGGFDGAELAARVGKSPVATRTMLCRARGRLREELIAGGFER